MRKLLVIVVMMGAVMLWAQVTDGPGFGFTPSATVAGCKSIAQLTLCPVADGFYVSTGGSATFTKMGIGAQGPKGDPGPQGPVGPQGLKGDPGTMPAAINCAGFTVDSTGVHFTGCH